MHILVSNDDGILAPGILALAQAMRGFGEVTVIAPEENQSANGHRKTLTKPLRVNEVRLSDGTLAYSTDGAPADCVALALLGFVEKPIDLVVAGINRGANLGQDVTYSGTVAATFEAAIFGKPAVAFSLNTRLMDADYTVAAGIAHKVIEKVIQFGLAPMTILSVNIPSLPADQIKGMQVARQGMRIYRDELLRRIDPSGRPYYWIAGAEPGGKVEEVGTDIKSLHDNYVALTPIQLDLTAYSLLSTIQSWGLS